MSSNPCNCMNYQSGETGAACGCMAMVSEVHVCGDGLRLRLNTGSCLWRTAWLQSSLLTCGVKQVLTQPLFCLTLPLPNYGNVDSCWNDCHKLICLHSNVVVSRCRFLSVEALYCSLHHILCCLCFGEWRLFCLPILRMRQVYSYLQLVIWKTVCEKNSCKLCWCLSSKFCFSFFIQKWSQSEHKIRSCLITVSLCSKLTTKFGQCLL